MRKTAPFWSLATLVSDSEEPAELQVSLEDMVSDSGRLVEGGLSRYEAKGTPFAEGDVLFGKLRPYLAKYWRADRPGTAGGDIHVYRPAEDVDSRFLGYLVGSRHFVRFAEAASKGVKMPRVEWMGLREFVVYRPDRVEQERIADYLDRETREIDAMILRLDELAGTLISRRIAVIDRAFVHTLEAPTVAVHLMADVTVGIVIEPSKLYVPPGTGVPALRGLNIAPGRIINENIVDISHEGHKAHSKSELRTGDVLTVRTGRVGTTAVVTDEWDGSNAIDLVITRLHNGNEARFFYWYLASSVARAQIDNDSVGSVQSHFNVGALNRLRAPLVDPDEQKGIAEHLDEVTGRIDQMLAKVADLTNLLLERRSALITDVVTGRKDIA